MHPTTEALAEMWRVWAATGRGMTEQQWSLPTRLDGWAAIHVFAHHSWSVGLLRGFARQAPVDGPPQAVGAAGWFRQIAELSRSSASTIEQMALTDAAENPPSVLIERFAPDGPKVIAEAHAAGDIVVTAVMAAVTIRLVDYAEVLLVESVIHLLDLQRALGLAPDIPAGALRLVARVMAELVDPVELVEAGCGRVGATVTPAIR